MLPGLWQILFSLGVFASSRLLPRATSGVAVFYLLTGLTTLSVARGDLAFLPLGDGPAVRRRPVPRRGRALTGPWSVTMIHDKTARR